MCGLILETLEVQRASLIPPRRITRELVDRPTCTDEERARILADFKRRLQSIAAYCDSLGTVPIFIVPGSNDGDYEPSRSALPGTMGPQARALFACEFERIQGLEQSEPERGCGRVQKADRADAPIRGVALPSGAVAGGIWVVG